MIEDDVSIDTVDLKNMSPQHRKGLGSTNGAAAPFLASSFVFHFPTRPARAYPQEGNLCFHPKSFNLLWCSQTIFIELIFGDPGALIAAWLSVMIAMF